MIAAVVSRSATLPQSFYRRSATEVARDLLGRHLIRKIGDRRLVLSIVETEAYLGVGDRASHAWNGRRTRRNQVLYERGGAAYVYLIYGMYHCLNAVTEGGEEGGAVLIRAGEPLVGLRSMQRRRRLARRPRAGDVAGGPGKLCQALDVDLRFNGCRLDDAALRIARGEPAAADRVVSAARIGVDYAGSAASWPLRFALRGNPHVSKPLPW